VLTQYMQHTYTLLMMQTLDSNEAFMMIRHKTIKILRHTFFFLLSRSLLFRFQLPPLTSFNSTNCLQVTSSNSIPPHSIYFLLFFVLQTVAGVNNGDPRTRSRKKSKYLNFEFFFRKKFKYFLNSKDQRRSFC
jgi:hypothetical protein